ncbi:hypothetical protein UUU_15250 [Klebsiella pneumoniae subsp. pneumoniae DSM 30104 = JCM 1662 = NBRC 14940]|nr:hypothetical protein UUU_15250 [Klebsiella pneumoniae subsp. pneumoniae DSM 30104 = JCM 1662 = NBRC 14940]
MIDIPTFFSEDAFNNLVYFHCAFIPVIRSQKYVSATEPIAPLTPAVASIM